MTGAGPARASPLLPLASLGPVLSSGATLGPGGDPPQVRLGARGPDPARKSTKALPHMLASYRPPRASFPCLRVWC